MYRMYLPLYKVADTPFYIKIDDIMYTVRKNFPANTIIHPMLAQCWPIVCYTGPTLGERLVFAGLSVHCRIVKYGNALYFHTAIWNFSYIFVWDNKPLQQWTDCRRQTLTSTVDPRTEGIKIFKMAVDP